MDQNLGKNGNGNGKSRDNNPENRPLGVPQNTPPVAGRRHHHEPGEIQIIRNGQEIFDATHHEQFPAQLRTKLTRAELLAGHASIEEKNGDPRIKSPDEFLLRAAPRKPSSLEPIIIKGSEEPSRKADKAAEPVQIVPPEEKSPLNNASTNNHYGMPDLSSLRTELELERKNLNGIHPIEEKAPLEIRKPIETKAPEIIINQPSGLPGFGTAKFENVKPREEILVDELKNKHEIEIQQWKDYASSVKTWQDQVMDVMNKLKGELKRAQNAERENEALKDLVKRKDEQLKTASQKPKLRLLDWMKNITRQSA